MKRTLMALAGVAALAATAAPALARDTSRGGQGYEQSYRGGGDRALRQQVNQVENDLSRAYRQGVIDHGALTRAMREVRSYRVFMRDGTTGYEARIIRNGLASIERTLERKRRWGNRDDDRRWDDRDTDRRW